jgi:hypothetical protein
LWTMSQYVLYFKHEQGGKAKCVRSRRKQDAYQERMPFCLDDASRLFYDLMIKIRISLYYDSDNVKVMYIWPTTKEHDV